MRKYGYILIILNMGSEGLVYPREFKQMSFKRFYMVYTIRIQCFLN